jgi:hypothetical protein
MSTPETILAAINIANTIAPEIANLISAIINSDPSKPVGEILNETGIQWDDNIKQAIDALAK